MENQQFQACIDACDRCATACDLCATACLGEDDVKAMARCVALDIDCAQICRVASGFMARGSQFAADICHACAAACQACADECAMHQMDHCQRCAEACRRCAEECLRMAGAAKQGSAGFMPQGTGAAATPTAASAEGGKVEQGNGAGMTSMT